MIFTMSIGTTGFGDERYLIYIPFSFPSGRELSFIESNTKFLGELEFKFHKLNNNYLALTVENFSSEQEAKEFLPKIKSAFLWVSIKYCIGISFPEDLSLIKLFEQSKKVPETGMVAELAKTASWNTTDGFYDSAKLLIIPNHKRLVRIEPGSVSVNAGLATQNFMSAIAEAISLPNPENIMSDKKLSLAINIYSSNFFEQTPQSKFIRLVTCLEALIPDSSIGGLQVQILERLKNEVKEERKKYDKNSSEWDAVNKLLARVGQLKRKSIGESMEEFILKKIMDDPSIGEVGETTNVIKDIYNRRSQLLHSGIADIKNLTVDLNFLSEFLPKLLKSLYISESREKPA